MKWLTIPLMLAMAALMIYATTGLPDRGDPAAPASQHVSPFYIENTIKDTHTPNIVTSVLADYRGYDTLGETVVILTAGLACVLILMRKKSH
ncbi:hydrogen gas-evolving membrane-bound hydrogenase subunit E [Chloroflexota bacterium]